MPFYSDALVQIEDRESVEDIQAITQRFVEQCNPVKVFLFGSFADGSYTEHSDYDFYLVMEDDSDLGEASSRAYKSIRYVGDRPVDIVLGTKTRFDNMSKSLDSLYVEGEVGRKGVLLYDNGRNDRLSQEIAV